MTTRILFACMSNVCDVQRFTIWQARRIAWCSKLSN